MKRGTYSKNFNIISLPLIPNKEINNFMEQTIDILSNINSKFDRLTNYILNIYVGDASLHLIFGIILI